MMLSQTFNSEQISLITLSSSLIEIERVPISSFCGFKVIVSNGQMHQSKVFAEESEAIFFGRLKAMEWNCHEREHPFVVVNLQTNKISAINEAAIAAYNHVAGKRSPLCTDEFISKLRKQGKLNFNLKEKGITGMAIYHPFGIMTYESI